jgi:hypothetical protein
MRRIGADQIQADDSAKICTIGVLPRSIFKSFWIARKVGVTAGSVK